jgi:hypothetical protein
MWIFRLSIVAIIHQKKPRISCIELVPKTEVLEQPLLFFIAIPSTLAGFF